MYIREIKGIPQVYDFKNSTFRLLPFEVKRVDFKDITEDMKNRAELGHILFIKESVKEVVKEVPKKAVKKEDK